MQTENIFIAHPTTPDQINALKAVVKAFKVKFEIKKGRFFYWSVFTDSPCMKLVSQQVKHPTM